MILFNPQGETREILDWFHLVENLYKVGGSNKRIYQAKKLLWQGKVDETLALFSCLKKKRERNKNLSCAKSSESKELQGERNRC